MIDGISLSGAADNIPFHTGALEVLGEAGVKPTKATGTSSGAIIASYVAQYHPSFLAKSAKQATEEVMDKINGIGKVSTPFFPPYLAALKRPGLRSTKKMDRILRGLIDPDCIRKGKWDLRVIATDLRTGKSKAFSPHMKADFVMAIRMSASYPGLFEALRFRDGGHLYTDGVLDTAPVGQCISLGAERIFSVSSADPDDVDGWDDSKANTLDVAFRVISLMQKDIWRKDLEAAKYINLLVEAGKLPGKRKVDLIDVRPSERLGKSTNFDKHEARRAHELGRADMLSSLRQEGITGTRNHV